MPKLRIDPVAAIAAGVIAVFYTVFSYVQWSSYVSPSWDLGIFTQLAKAYAHVEVPIVPIKGPDFNLLGDHFHPILVLLAPAYWIHPSGFTLLVVQNLLFALGAYPILRYAATVLDRIGTVLLAISYGLSWAFISAVWSQFHEIAFAVPLLAFGLVWWLEGHYLRASITLSLLAFVKEDLGLTLVAFGCAILLAWREQWRHAVFHILWGAAWFVLATKVILPALNPDGAWDYGDNLSLLSQLAEGWPLKLITTCLLIGALGIVGLKSPLALVMGPTLAWRFLGNVEYYWGWYFHYSAVLIPVAAVALLHAVDRQTTRIAPAIAAAFSLGMLPFTQIHYLWDMGGAASDGSGAVAVASQYDTVAADTQLLAYLAPETTVYWYGSMGDVEVDAIAVNWWSLGEPAEPWAEKRFGGDWVTVYSHDRWEVIERR